MSTKVSSIPVMTRVFRDTKANLDALTGLREEDLGYGTDTNILYRWSGAAWQDLTTPVPSGLIVMWHGTIANIPAGWVICDGNNSTPNLLGKFVESVPNAATDPGATGGATNKTTAGHTHSCGGASSTGTTTLGAGSTVALDHTHSIGNQTDTIADIRPPYYDVAFIMKT